MINLTLEEKLDIIDRFHTRLDEASRLLPSRGPSSNRGKRRRMQASRLNDAALKKANISRAKSRGMPKETIIQRSGDNEMSTIVTTHKTPENFIRANLPRIKTKNGEPERLSTNERSLIAKRLHKQIRKSGGGSKSRIHDPEITSNLPMKSSDLDMSDAKSRVKNLKKAAKEIPSNIEKAGGKPGDVVSGHPANPNDGDSKRGKTARANIYSKIPGAPKKHDRITGKMMGVLKK